MKKIGSILAKLVCILMTLIMAVGIFLYAGMISEAESKPKGMPVLYQNRLYLKEELVEQLKGERMVAIVLFAVFLALTVFLFVRSSLKKKRSAQ